MLCILTKPKRGPYVCPCLMQWKRQTMALRQNFDLGTPPYVTCGPFAWYEGIMLECCAIMDHGTLLRSLGSKCVQRYLLVICYLFFGQWWNSNAFDSHVYITAHNIFACRLYSCLPGSVLFEHQPLPIDPFKNLCLQNPQEGYSKPITIFIANTWTSRFLVC